MVSTRQMSIVGGGGGSSDGAGPSNAEVSSRTTRHTAFPPINSPPHNPQWTLVKPILGLSHPRNFTTGFLDLPPELTEKIFSHLKFKNVAHLRMVCRQMNVLCSSYLNLSFQRLLSQMLHRYQGIKAKMPRRESARRTHPLACESDIIETLHMRLALLQMTLGKHIERKYCCFFPGEILDEVYSILDYLKVTCKLARPYKVTDELFDLSTMAMEYFKEHMEPNLPEITYFGTDFFDITGTFSPGDANKSYLSLDSPPPSGSGTGGSNAGDLGGVLAIQGQSQCLPEEEPLPPSPQPVQNNMVLRKRIHRIKQGMKRYNNQLTALRSDLRSCKRKTAWQQKLLAEQQRQLAEQQKQTLEYAARLDENDKKNEETSRKFQTLLQELNKCRTELQYWRSKSPPTPAQPLCSECGASTPPPLPLPLPLQHLSVDQDDSNVDLWAASTVPEAAGPSPQVPPVAAPPPPPLPAAEAFILEHPMSPKAQAATSSKTPGSPKARRPAALEGKALLSDDGVSVSKRGLGDDASSPSDHKKRRVHRSSKPRKP